MNMNTSIRRIAIAAGLAVFAAGLGGVGGVGLEGSRASAAAVAQDGFGSATVTVVHSETGKPLAGLPVTVQEVVTPDSDTGQTWVVMTDRMGNANFWTLPEGMYITYVYYNNVMSEPVAFEIIQDFHPFVLLSFNPDID